MRACTGKNARSAGLGPWSSRPVVPAPDFVPHCRTVGDWWSRFPVIGHGADPDNALMRNVFTSLRGRADCPSGTIHAPPCGERRRQNASPDSFLRASSSAPTRIFGKHPWGAHCEATPKECAMNENPSLVASVKNGVVSAVKGTGDVAKAAID